MKLAKTVHCRMVLELCDLGETQVNVHFFAMPRITDTQRAFFQKSWTFGLGQTFWAETFWGVCDIFGQTLSTRFGTVSSLSMFSINQPLFLQKNYAVIPKSQIFIWDWGLNLGRKGFGIWIQRLIFCKKYGWIMENMDKELTVTKWVLIVQPKILQICTSKKLTQMSSQAQKLQSMKV